MRKILPLLLLLLCSCGREWNSPYEPENLLPSAGLVAWYPFDGDARDLSVNGYHHRVVNVQFTPDRFNRTGHAISFSGGSSYTVNSLVLTMQPEFSISMWIYPEAEHQIDSESLTGATGTQGQRYILGPTHGANWSETYVGLGLSAGTNGISIYEHGADYMPPVLVWPGKISGWTHIVILYQNRKAVLLVNGEVKKSGLQSTRAAQPSTYYFGAAWHGTGSGNAITSFYKGKLDDLRVYDRVLSGKEITALYHEKATSAQAE